MKLSRFVLGLFEASPESVLASRIPGLLWSRKFFSIRLSWFALGLLGTMSWGVPALEGVRVGPEGVGSLSARATVSVVPCACSRS